MTTTQEGSVHESAELDEAAIEHCARLNVRPDPSYIETPGLRLPPPGAKRWWPHRKAAVVAAVRDGILSLDEACERYQLSVEEYLTWKHGIDLFGLAGLRLDGAQKRRKALAPSTD
jgi:hypothetical protein